MLGSAASKAASDITAPRSNGFGDQPLAAKPLLGGDDGREPLDEPGHVPAARRELGRRDTPPQRLEERSIVAADVDRAPWVLPCNCRRYEVLEMARTLELLGTVSYNRFLLKFKSNGYEITVFTDGRAIVKGTTDIGVARSLYARYVGA